MITTTFTPLTGFVGGILIGFSALLLLLVSGRLAGISGILGGLLKPVSGDVKWRALFVVGLISGAGIYIFLTGDLGVQVSANMPLMIVAGLLVGIGTRLGSGCTSGHGVCGIGRLSRRSFVATAIFMSMAIATVFVTRHLVGVV